MLRTTPESWNERQPISNQHQSIWLTADARVDNRDELRAELVARGITLTTDTDGELILRSYELWGDSCPAKIIGDFAFAIWDARLRRLFCARDPFGIKPLYYYFNGRTFCCASSLEAIHCDTSASPDLCLGFIGSILLSRYGGSNATLYQNTFRLLPAHYLVVENGRLRTTRYWDLDPDYTVHHSTDADYMEHFLALWRESIAARLRSKRPVGALLSGGLDSSSVFCSALATSHTRGIEPARAFSIVFDDLPCDERTYIESIAQKWSATVIQLKPTGWLDFDRTREYPGCFYAPTLFMIGPALECANQDRVRVMLTGIGGDDVLASSAVHLTDMMRQARFGELMRQLPHDARQLSCSRWALVRDHCIKPLVPRAARSIIRAFRSDARRTEIPQWINPQCVAALAIAASSSSDVRRRFSTLAQQNIHRAIAYGWNTNVALGRLDHFASHFAIECRHPFFDRRLVEFICAIPEEQRWIGPWRKAILRRAMAGLLPEDVRYRTTKANFSPLVDREFVQRQASKVMDLILSSKLGELGIIRIPEFQQLFERYRSGAVSSQERLACHNAVGLELMCRSVGLRS
jgi:asparagine synthase (glutamine-hydrolysing)